VIQPRARRIREAGAGAELDHHATFRTLLYRMLRRALLAIPVALACLLATGCHDADWLSFDWDDRPVLCSQSVDDRTQHPPWQMIEQEMQLAGPHDRVVLLHAHSPGESITLSAIKRVLDLADLHRLPMLTYRDLDPTAKPRAGVALAFDDNSIDRWFGIRELLRSRHAHVTFFVSRWGSRSKEEQLQLRQLADDGHGIEPHSVGHRHVSDYVRDHGVEGYLADELLPSMDGLVSAGYPAPTIYAYPFGERPKLLDAAVLEYVPRVRVSPGACPY
jgi:Polysaccharide deacetylase